MFISVGIDPDAQIKAQMPDLLIDQWNYFLDLASTRKSNGYAGLALDYEMIRAYFYLIQAVPQQWEIDLIRRLDHIALKVLSER